MTNVICPKWEYTERAPSREQQWGDRGQMIWQPTGCSEYYYIDSDEKISVRGSDGYTAHLWLHSAQDRREHAARLRCARHHCAPQLMVRIHAVRARLNPLRNTKYTQKRIIMSQIPDYETKFHPIADQAAWRMLTYWENIGPKTSLHDLWGHK